MSVTQIQQMIHISSHIGQVCTCYWSFSSIIDCLMQKAKPKLDSVPKEAFESSLNGLNFTKPALFIFTLLYHVSCYQCFITSWLTCRKWVKNVICLKSSNMIYLKHIHSINYLNTLDYYFSLSYCHPSV